jgi:hypothetical protein
VACAAASTSNARSLRASQVVALGALELLDDLAAFSEKAPRFLSPEAVLTRGVLEPLGEGATIGLGLSGARSLRRCGFGGREVRALEDGGGHRPPAENGAELLSVRDRTMFGPEPPRSEGCQRARRTSPHVL